MSKFSYFIGNNQSMIVHRYIAFMTKSKFDEVIKTLTYMKVLKYENFDLTLRDILTLHNDIL